MNTKATKPRERLRYLSKAVHSAVIADPNGLFAPIEVTVLIWSTSWIVNDHGWGATLDYMNGNVINPGECQDLWLPAPYPGIAHGGAINFELLRGHESGIRGANTVLAIH